MIDSLLDYLANHKSTVVGAVTTILESLTIIINWWRRTRHEQQVQSMRTSIDVNVVYDSGKANTKLRRFLWAANPINLFRKL